MRGKIKRLLKYIFSKPNVTVKNVKDSTVIIKINDEEYKQK